MQLRCLRSRLRGELCPRAPAASLLEVAHASQRFTRFSEKERNVDPRVDGAPQLPPPRVYNRVVEALVHEARLLHRLGPGCESTASPLADEM